MSISTSKSGVREGLWSDNLRRTFWRLFKKQEISGPVEDPLALSII